MAQHGEQRIVITVHVQQRDRLLVITKLRPRVGLEQLFERADTAGHGYKRIGEIGHFLLALMHVGHDVQLGQAVVADFLVHQQFGNHADSAATAREHFVGDGAHQPHAAAAVDQREICFDQRASERFCRFGIDRSGSIGGAAIYADCFH